jgi:transglutaminase-like putative cysteine protease/predicted glutamine amidotransferase
MPTEPPDKRSSPPPEGAAWKRVEHKLTRLVALSFDGAASPSITLKALGKQTVDNNQPYGWGLAWYPGQTSCALVVKDPTSIGDNAMTKLLSDWERFESTVFVGHLRGAARTLQEQDTQPFSRSYAGRDWALAHNGDLLANLEADLPLGEDPVFEPVGRTDSEYAFCWLLARLRERRARRLADVGWEQLRTWFARLDELGTANFMLTDGVDLAVYADEEGYNELYWARFTPPHDSLKLETHDIVIDLDDAVDRARTVVVVVTRPLSTGTWHRISPGELLVVRRGAIIHETESDERTAQRKVAPLSPASAPTSLRSNMLLPPIPRMESGTQVPGRGAHAPAVTAPRPPPPTAPPGSLGSSPPRPSVPPGAISDAPAAVALPLRDRALILPGSRVVSVVHETIYRYRQPVERSAHLFRLKPVHDKFQELLEHDLSISCDGLRRDYEDVFGNHVTSGEIENPYRELRIASRSIVRLSGEPSRPLHSPQRRFTIPLVWMPWQRQMMLPYLLPPELPETQLNELYEFAMTFTERQDNDLVQTLLDMNLTIYRDFKYVSGSTTLATTPFDVYCNRRGVCQDFANLLICLARLLSIPARYRVGYIYTGGNYENKVQSEASHAWVELYLPWMGWQGFDPTNGCLVGRDHVRVACGRNYRDATPTSGTIYKGGGTETLSVDVRVQDLE